jgi:pimeloyl-ACP methyl ester carboxylesterase
MPNKIVDLIVQFRGAASPGPLSDNEVFPDSRLVNYNARAAGANRQVERVGLKTNTIGQQSAIILDQTMNLMRDKLRDQIRGRIFIYGSSSGGRNALDLALRLSVNNVLVTYLGVLDAAFFPNETKTSPGDPLKDPPVFDLPSPLLVFKRQNFYQLAGNDTKMSFHGTIFTSDMPNTEIHGAIDGMDSQDLTDDVIRNSPWEGLRSLRAANYHGKCIELALPTAQSAISVLLDSF